MVVIRESAPICLGAQLIGAMIVLAYAHANTSERATYVSLFCAKLEENEVKEELHGTENTELISHVGCSCTDDALVKPEKQLFDMRVRLSAEKWVNQFDWARIENSSTHKPDDLYLNIRLMELYCLSQTKEGKYMALLLIYCTILHELANMLHLRLCRNSADRSWAERWKCSIDYGSELEYRVFGGRLITTPDLTRLRMECRDGKIYELDAMSYYLRIFGEGSHRPDFEKLQEITVTRAEEGELWIGLAAGSRGTS